MKIFCDYIIKFIFLYKFDNQMATTIKITPTLKGKSSKDFNESLYSGKSIKISSDKVKAMEILVKKVLSNKKK